MAGRPESRNTYDAVPYPDMPHKTAHPRHLEAVATLFGVQPPPIPQCRVLELGCAAGGNLIPAALELPGSTFLGIDLSARQIDSGRQVVETLGLKNIELRAANILEVSDDWGQFDYIICHGVLSWVPPEVGEKIFDICHRNLSPDGVAVVSYNTYPGWHLSAIARELMVFHASRFEDPARQISEARGVLQFMTETSRQLPEVHRLFQRELEMVDGGGDTYIFHDLLSPHNQPFYFSQVLELAAARRLQYLAESEVAGMLLQNYPQELRERLSGLPLPVQEQYCDFYHCRRFRSTLFCHEDVAIQRQVPAERIRRFHVALTQPLPSSDFDIRGDELVEFKVEKRFLRTRAPIVKAAMRHMSEIYPVHVSFDQLHAAAADRLGLSLPAGSPEAESHAGLLSAGLMAGCAAGMLDICVHPPRCVRQVSERPLANPLVRLQAAKAGLLTNQRHHRVNLGKMHAHVVRRLDGRHTRRELARSLADAIDAGEITETDDGRQVSPDPAALAMEVDRVLSRVSQSALLVS